MHNDLLTIGKFTLHGYSVMIALGFIIAMGLCLLRAKKKNVDGDVITDIGLIGVIAGFLGAKILYIIVSYKELIADPKSVIGFPQIFAGFVAYGGIIFGFLAILVYAKIKKINAAEYLDFMIPFIAMVQGFGRIGCFLAGCCYGAPTDSFLGVTFPAPHQMAGMAHTAFLGSRRFCNLRYPSSVFHENQKERNGQRSLCNSLCCGKIHS